MLYSRCWYILLSLQNGFGQYKYVDVERERVGEREIEEGNACTRCGAFFNEHFIAHIRFYINAYLYFISYTYLHMYTRIYTKQTSRINTSKICATKFFVCSVCSNINFSSSPPRLCLIIESYSYKQIAGMRIYFIYHRLYMYVLHIYGGIWLFCG